MPNGCFNPITTEQDNPIPWFEQAHAQHKLNTPNW